MTDRFSLRALVVCPAWVLGLCCAIATPAWAHVHLVRSAPDNGARLSAAPAAVRLWFSESPELALLRVTMRSVGGASITVGSPSTVPSDALEIVVPLPRGVPSGQYIVEWHAVSRDGHPSSGSFRFAIEGAAPPLPTSATGAGTTSPSRRASANGSLAPAYVAIRALWFVALLATIGAVMFRVAVLSRADLHQSLRRDVARQVARFGAAGAVTLLVSAVLRLAEQRGVLENAIGGPIALSEILVHTGWGAGWVTEAVGGLVVAIALAAAARRDSGAAWAWSALGCAAVAVAPALTGHAGALPHLTIFAVSDDMAHVVAASSWLGSLLCLMAVAVPFVAAQGGHDAWGDIARLVNAFSPVALISAAIVACTGVVTVLLHADNVSALLASQYARVLGVKLALVLVAGAIGAFNWRRVRPALGTEAGTRRLRLSAANEIAIGLLVVIVTAVLVATKTPT